MRIFAISTVKNEADVIEANLKAASEWADKIFILDNGSTDGTWEKVLALRDDIITPWKQDPAPFRDSMRSQVYHAFKHLAKRGDWWCIRLDGDEFYAEDPRAFLSQVPRMYHYICARFIQFRLTTEDIAEHRFTGDFLQDRAYINYFEKSAWVEARFVRHRTGLNWPADNPFPRHMGIVYPRPVNMLHYQYRSPAQVQSRLDVRQAAKALGHHSPHVKEHRWEETLISRAALYDIRDNPDMSAIPSDQGYLHKPHIYWMKRILHGLGILP